MEKEFHLQSLQPCGAASFVPALQAVSWTCVPFLEGLILPSCCVQVSLAESSLLFPEAYCFSLLTLVPCGSVLRQVCPPSMPRQSSTPVPAWVQNPPITDLSSVTRAVDGT